MTTSPSDRPDKITLMIGVGIFILTLILYLLTSYPTVAFIDSGELAVVNWTLGIAHPTGYPLYTLVGRLFAMLPLTLITSQILFGALCAAIAIAVLYLIIAALGGYRRAIVIPVSAAALVLATSELIWSQGTTNEVYGLHLLFVSIMLWLLFRKFSARNLVIISYITGLSCGNHLSTILTLPMLAAYLIVNRQQVRKVPMTLLYSALAGIAALSIYLYLPIRSALDPLMNWGEPGNWENLLRHVSGWQYRIWMFDRTAAELVEQLGKFAVILFKQFPLSLWPLIIYGFYRGLTRHRGLALYLMLLLLCNIIYALNFSIPDIDNYLLPAVIAIFLFTAFTVVEIPTMPKLQKIIVLLLVAISLPLSIYTNWQTQDQTGNYAAADGVENFFRSCDPNSLIICGNWDYVSPWIYLHFYQHERVDVIIVDPELVRRSWYFDFIRHADSSLYRYIEPEIENFMPHVRRFETGLMYKPGEIEGAYRALLLKIMMYPQKFVYFDQLVRLTTKPPGEIQKAGKLLRLVRPDEVFTPPPENFQPLRFGKPDRYLTERERWHLNLSQRLSGDRIGP